MGSGSAPNGEVIAIIKRHLEPDPRDFPVRKFRELYEELSGGREHIRPRALARPQFFYRRNPPRAAPMETLASAGMPLPDSFEELETFTSFDALYRYVDLDSAFAMDRQRARATL